MHGTCQVCLLSSQSVESIVHCRRHGVWTRCKHHSARRGQRLALHEFVPVADGRPRYADRFNSPHHSHHCAVHFSERASSPELGATTMVRCADPFDPKLSLRRHANDLPEDSCKTRSVREVSHWSHIPSCGCGSDAESPSPLQKHVRVAGGNAEEGNTPLVVTGNGRADGDANDMSPEG